ncbi:MAG: hypothetical protein ABSB82_18690 [Terriglobia bacterium]|jgi:hypothetical protein
MIRKTANSASHIILAFLIPLSLSAWGGARPPQAKEEIEEINTEFHFVGPDDTLLIHEEEGRLKGQIDVFQGEEESDTVLTYLITIGTRKNDHVEIKTGTIHRRYYRFSGTVERGSGHKEKDADYLRLVGDLEIITVNGDTGQESVVKKHVIFKSLSASEMADQ